jgi:hypothetical protein
VRGENQSAKIEKQNYKSKFKKIVERYRERMVSSGPRPTLLNFALFRMMGRDEGVSYGG